MIKLVSFFKTIIRVIYNNRHFTFSFLIVAMGFIFIVQYNSNFFSFLDENKLKNENKENIVNQVNKNKFLRVLKIEENNTFFEKFFGERDLLNEYINMTVNKALKRYKFIKNLTEFVYLGEWNNLNFTNNKFKDKSGEALFYFSARKSDDFLLSLSREKNNSNYTFIFQLNDGKYNDNFLYCSIIVNFSDYYKILYEVNNNYINKINIDIEGRNMTLNYGKFLELKNKKEIQNVSLSIEIIKNHKKFLKRMEHQLSETNFGKINVKIVKKSLNESEQFSVEFFGEAAKNLNYPKRILNYSICVTFLGFIEIFFTAKLLLSLNENYQFALNISIATFIINIMWCSLVCAINFYKALSSSNLTYEYGMPSLTYFFLFSVFQLRILYISWKGRNAEIMYRDMREFRRRLFKFYLTFYFILFLTLITLKIWYTYILLTLILFDLTWVFQILYSYKTSTKPPMNFNYIFIVTFIKIFLLVYIKCYSNNLFEVRPEYLKVSIAVVILLIETIVLCLQKIIGPKFFIPKQYREQSYNYYREENEISEEFKSQECIICLENLSKIYEVDNKKKEEIVHHDYGDGNENNNIYDKLIEYMNFFNKKEKKLPYMISPCNHIFHTYCLEKWLELKNECPYCRQKIPPLEV